MKIFHENFSIFHTTYFYNVRGTDTYILVYLLALNSVLNIILPGATMIGLNIAIMK